MLALSVCVRTPVSPADKLVCCSCRACRFAAHRDYKRSRYDDERDRGRSRHDRDY